jgi:hypothetical protein
MYTPRQLPLFDSAELAKCDPEAERKAREKERAEADSAEAIKRGAWPFSVMALVTSTLSRRHD